MSGQDGRGARGEEEAADEEEFFVVGQGLGGSGGAGGESRGGETSTRQAALGAGAGASAQGFAAGQSRSAGRARRGPRTTSSGSSRRRQQAATEAHRARIYGNTSAAARAAARARPAAFAGQGSGSDDDGADADVAEAMRFTQRNRFAGFDPDHVAANSPVLNSLLAAQPSWLTAGGAGAAAGLAQGGGRRSGRSRRPPVDFGDTWGVDDESEEHMQRLLEQSYAASMHAGFGASFGGAGAGDDDEAAMMEAAIRASLETAKAGEEDGDGDVLRDGGSAVDLRSDADKEVDDEALARALEMSVRMEKDSEKLNQDIIDVQIASLFESEPSEVVMQTISIFDEMRERYEKEGGAIPSVDDALTRAKRQLKQRQQEEEAQAAIDLQFEEFADSQPPEILAEARQIFHDLNKEMAESGGRAHSVEYALSLAQDRAKARLAEQQQAQAAEEQRKKDAREQETAARNRETREERAARIASSFDRRK